MSLPNVAWPNIIAFWDKMTRFGDEKRAIVVVYFYFSKDSHNTVISR